MPSVVVCAGWYHEVGISTCMYGCKIYRCEECSHEKIIHSLIYGCREAS